MREMKGFILETGNGRRANSVLSERFIVLFINCLWLPFMPRFCRWGWQAPFQFLYAALSQRDNNFCVKPEATWQAEGREQNKPNASVLYMGSYHSQCTGVTRKAMRVCWRSVSAWGTICFKFQFEANAAWPLYSATRVLCPCRQTQVGRGKYISWFWIWSSEPKPKMDDLHWLWTDAFYVFKQKKRQSCLTFPDYSPTAMEMSPHPIYLQCKVHVITWYSQHWLSLKNLFAFKDRQGNIYGTKIVKYVQLFYNLGVKYPSLMRKMQKCGLIIPNLN